MNKLSYQELEERIQELEKESLRRKQIEGELLEKQSTLRKQNINLIRKSIELSDIMRELEDRYYDLELSNSDLAMTLAALRENEKKFRTLTENINVGIFRVTPGLRGRFIEANPSLIRILGYDTKKELFKINISELYEIGYDGKKFNQKILKDQEHRFKNKDGSFIWASVSATPVYDDKGKVKYYDGVIEDITEHRRAEKIQESLYEISEAVHSVESLEDLYKKIHDTISELMHARNFYIAIIDRSKKMLQFPYFVDEEEDNPGPLKLGTGLTEYVLRSGKALLASPEMFNELERKGEVISIGPPSIDWLGVPLKAEERTIGAMVVQTYTEGVRYREEDKNILMFISEQIAMAIDRKQAESELKSQKEFLNQLFESSANALMLVNSKREIAKINNMALKLLGRSKEEVIGSRCHEVICPPEQTQCPIFDLKDDLITSERVVIDKAGKRIPVLKTVTKIESGEGSFLLESFIDITERKLVMEELRLAKETAEIASQAKSDFLANMSHELRTPLNAIIGFSELLCENYFGELNKTQKEYVHDIHESGAHLLSMINDILDLSKIEAGRYELQLSNINLKSLLEDSLVMVKEKCFAHGISLDLQIPRELANFEIMADDRILKQVMLNLLSNAAKFTPDNGSINLEARCEGKELIISVSDNGFGIAPEHLEMIFEEFYQVRGGIKDKANGTGLGLCLTKRFVEMHGGRIWVESEGEGKGSQFSFMLPLSN